MTFRTLDPQPIFRTLQQARFTRAARAVQLEQEIEDTEKRARVCRALELSENATTGEIYAEVRALLGEEDPIPADPQQEGAPPGDPAVEFSRLERPAPKSAFTLTERQHQIARDAGIDPVVYAAKLRAHGL